MSQHYERVVVKKWNSRSIGVSNVGTANQSARHGISH